jgi:myo-inositol-1(or 4)-monophosphatase
MSENAVLLRYHTATALARAAGTLALGYYEDRDRLGTKMKGFQDFLTEADGAVESMLRREIAAAFPEDGFLGEEGGGGESESLWIVDPIDGTANFSRGEPHWCISIGFMRRSVPEIGVVFAPVLDELFAARRGGGATLNGRPIHVSDTTDPRASAIELGWSTRRPTRAYIDAVERVFAFGGAPKRSASGALGMAWVAAGRTDGYLEAHINSWDVAAGIVLVREAGGVVNDFFAGDGVLQGNAIVAATPAMAELLAEAVGLEKSALLAPVGR